MSRRQIDLAEACYANDFGCSLKELGLKEMITENVAWCHGESYLHPDIPYPEFMRR